MSFHLQTSAADEQTKTERKVVEPRASPAGSHSRFSHHRNAPIEVCYRARNPEVISAVRCSGSASQRNPEVFRAGVSG